MDYRVVMYPSDGTSKWPERSFATCAEVCAFVRAAAGSVGRGAKVLPGVSIHCRLTTSQQRCVFIALATDRWGVVCTREENDFPEEWYASVGDAAEDDLYARWEQDECIGRRNLIAIDLAESAVLAWMRDGRLVDGIRWQD